MSGIVSSSSLGLVTNTLNVRNKIQPMIPPKRFGISPSDWGMVRRSRCVHSSLGPFRTLQMLLPNFQISKTYHLNVLAFPLLTGGWSEGLDAFIRS